MGKPKHRKSKRRGTFWRTIFRYYAWAARARVRRTFLRATGPKEVARASRDYDKDGTYIRPVIQPYQWRHYVAPEDLERYEASIGGWVFAFELWPGDGHEIRKAAYDAAEENFGPYVDSQPLDYIKADNDRAAAALPEMITK
jgi:hypothetical protein